MKTLTLILSLYAILLFGCDDDSEGSDHNSCNNDTTAVDTTRMDSIKGITFEVSFGVPEKANEGHSVQQTSDRGYAVAGITEGDFYLVRVDSLGKILWSKTYGGTGQEFGESLCLTNDNGYVIAGQTRSFGVKYGDVYAVRTTASGNVVWSKTYGDSSSLDHANCVIQTQDGGYLLSGWKWDIDHGLPFYNLIIKTNSNGDTVWTRCYGGTNHESIESAIEVNDGYVFVGQTLNIGAGSSDAELLKTDKNGNLIWKKAFGGTGYDEGYSIDQTSDGGFIICGYTESNASGPADMYIVKTDANGNFSWSRKIGGTFYDIGYSIIQESGGGFVVCGSSPGDGTEGWIYLEKMDASGNTDWTRRFGSRYDKPFDLKQAEDGGYVFCGYKVRDSFIADVYLIKTDQKGYVKAKK